MSNPFVRIPGSQIHENRKAVELQKRHLPEGKKIAPGPENGDGAPGKPSDQTGYLDSTLLHMQNFFDCVRSRKEPICPFEMGFRTAIACQMAIASCRQQRTVRWDPQAEEIV